MTLRVGILGVAHVHTPSYVQCLQAHPQVELVGLYDSNAERAANAAEGYGIPALALDALLDANLGAVVICAENAPHRALVEAAAGRVRAILCEKPIATTMADAQAIIDICEQTGTRIQIAFPVRFTTAVQSLKDLIDKGTLGRIHVARTTNHGTMPGGWFVDPELSGGGAVMDHTVHVIDLLRWLWPGAEVEEVYAEVGHELLHPGLGIDDAGLLSFRMTNGVTATLDTSWSRPKGYLTWGDVTLELVGEKGYVEVDVFAQTVLYAATGAGARQVGYGINHDAALLNDFVDMALTDRQPSITGWDGLKAMEVALAAYESGRTGQPVKLV